MQKHNSRFNKKSKKIIYFYIAVFAVACGFVLSKQSFASKNSITNSLTSKETTITTTEATKIEEKIFGYSEEGRAIEGYEIGNGEDVLFFFGSIHGNEMGTVDLLETLIEKIKTEPSIVDSSKKLIIIPCVNPDGYYDRIDKLNANEVNLNLNFATSDWQQYGPDNGDYAGDEPFSEKESQVIKEIVETYNPDLMISYHSSGFIVTPEYNHKPSSDLALWYAEMTGYTYYDDESWDYPGTATKWFMETTDNPAITIELTDNENSDWNINKDALTELISTDIF